MSCQSRAIGIDLGTTNMCVCTIDDNGLPKIIPNPMGDNGNIIPSFIRFSRNVIIVGNAAKTSASPTIIKNTIYDVKRLIGRKFNDPVVQSDMKHWPFEVIGEDSKIKICVEHSGKRVTLFPEQFSALQLSYLKKAAEDFLGQIANNAVITVPAYFNNSQRQATKFAAEIAGFKVLRIINEPTAAAIAYCMDKNVNKHVLIFDFGGGTFDVSIIHIDGRSLTVKAVGGDDHLGGEDLTKNLMDYCIQDFESKNSVQLDNLDLKTKARLYEQCEKGKKYLSQSETWDIYIDCFSGNNNLELSLTQTHFEDCNKNVFDKIMKLVKSCLSDSKLKKSAIKEIILVGGSTRVPIVERLLKDYFGEDVIISKTVNPDEVVAVGAAYLAAQLEGSITKTGKVEVHEVTSKSLGKKVVDGKMSFVIKKNTKIPVEKSKYYRTTNDDQTHIDIDIYEGEEEHVEDNHLLGKFTIDNLTKAAKGKTEHEVTFNIDVNGILSVRSKEKNKDNEKAITITHSGLWSKDDIEKMQLSNNEFIKSLSK